MEFDVGGYEVDHSDDTIEGNAGFFGCSQPWCAADELDELRCVEYDVIEKGYMQVAESRGIDVGHEVVQVFAVPFEVKICKDREDRACRGWRRSGCPVRAR
jgi:hypothetical protein